MIYLDSAIANASRTAGTASRLLLIVHLLVIRLLWPTSEYHFCGTPPDLDPNGSIGPALQCPGAHEAAPAGSCPGQCADDRCGSWVSAAKGAPCHWLVGDVVCLQGLQVLRIDTQFSYSHALDTINTCIGGLRSCDPDIQCRQTARADRLSEYISRS